MFVIVFAAYLGGISPMLLLLGGGVLMSLYRMIGRKGSSPGLSLVFPVLSRFLQSIALQMQPFNLHAFLGVSKSRRIDVGQRLCSYGFYP